MIAVSINGIKGALVQVYARVSFVLVGKRRPKIFCIGFNKTGTTSIHRALIREGVLVGDQRVAERLTDDYLNGIVDPLLKFCNTAQAFQDSPFSLTNTYRHLFNNYPDAKFILTIRDDPDTWYDSQLNFAAKRLGHTPRLEDLKRSTYSSLGWSYRVHEYLYGAHTEFEDRKTKTDVYEKHIREVKDFFRERKGNLLVLNLKEEDAFARFCSFVGIRSRHDAFPWANKT